MKIAVVLLIVLSLVMMIGIQQRKEAESRRAAEVARQEEAARAEAEQARVAEEDRQYRAAERARREEEIRVRKEEKARREAELKAEKERKEKEKQDAAKAAEEKAVQDELRACEMLRERMSAVLKGARMRPWKNVPEEDDPNRAQGEHSFVFVFPKEAGGVIYVELKTASGRPVAVKQVEEAAGSRQIGVEDFRQLTAVNPHLVVSGTNVYFRAARGVAVPTHVPVEGEEFNPSAIVFGALSSVVAAFDLRTDDFVYGVYLQVPEKDVDIPIAKVAFGKGVPAATFRERVAQWERRNGGGQQKSETAAPRKRTVVFTDDMRIKKRVDGVIEVPREFEYASGNKHRYREGTIQYQNEIKKEEVAKKKWQALFDEARRQEEQEQESKKNVRKPVSPLESGKVVYRLYEEPASARQERVEPR